MPEPTTPPRPSPRELWVQAAGGTSRFNRDEYIALLREHGHLVTLAPGEQREALPCGWSPARPAPSEEPA